jgi:hypothetical protein
MARHLSRTPETERLALEMLRAGNTRSCVRSALKIPKTTWQRWLQDEDWLDAVEAAEAEAVARNVAVIQKAAQSQWQAAAWWLERRYPDEWRLRDALATAHAITVRFESGDPPAGPARGSEGGSGGGEEIQRARVRPEMGEDPVDG